MNKFTLSFKEKSFEEEYIRNQHKKEMVWYKMIMVIILIIGVVSCINSFIQQKFIQSLIQLIADLFLILTYFSGQRNQLVMEISTFLISIGINLQIYFLFLEKKFNRADISIDDYYIMGLLHSQIQIGFLIGVRYYLKSLSLIQNTLVVLVYFSSEGGKIYNDYMIPYLISTIICIIYHYRNEKQKRSIFMMKLSKRKILNGLDQNMRISTLRCQYDKQSRQIKLVNNNKSSEKELGIGEKGQYKKLLRNEKIKFKKNTNQSYEEELEQCYEDIRYFQTKKVNGSLTLEKFLFLLLNNKKKFCKLFKVKDNEIYNQNFFFTGWFQQKYLTIQVYVNIEQIEQASLIILNNVHLYQHLFLKNQIQMLKLVQEKYLQESQKFSQGLTFLKELMKNEQLKNNYFALFSRVFLYQRYNTMVNISFFCNQKSNQRIITFSLTQMLLELKSILSPILQQKNIKLKIQNNLNKQKITSCYWKLYQILFNLIINCIQENMPGSVILVRIKLTRNQLIKFSIKDEQPFLYHELKKLPLLNPATLEDYIKLNHNEKLKLGLIVANKLISEIGENNKFKVRYGESDKQISFTIIPDLNMIPQNKFCTQGRFILKFIEKNRN